MAGGRGVRDRRRSVFSAEAPMVGVFDGDDARERGVRIGRRGIGDLVGTSGSCSGARLEAEAMEDAGRDA